MRGLILALQFLTRLPTPRLSQLPANGLAACAPWFALVGLLIGILLVAALKLGQLVDPWLAALCALAVWVGITGALHLDGLADLSDALGALHRSRERFLEVLKDPHLGSFGAITMMMLLLAKLILLMLIARHPVTMWGLCLVPAWSRYFAVIWSHSLPPLTAGSGQNFAGPRHLPSLALNFVGLLALSCLWQPMLLLAPFAALAWWAFLRYRIGGMNGDCLGAGIELCELGLLGLLLFSVT